MGNPIASRQVTAHTPSPLFSIGEKEMLCALNLDEASQHWQELLAGELHSVFKDGALINDELIGVDKWKAKKYALTLQRQAHNDTMWRAETVYTFSRWMNDIRLLLLRTNRFLTLLGKTVLNGISFVLSAVGCSYLLRFLFDLGVVLKHGFMPENQHERDAGFIKRCQMALHREGRAFRMRNDLVWFLINTTTFVTSLFSLGIPKLVGSILNIVGFGFDALHESHEYKAIQKQKKLFAKIAHHLVALQQEMQGLTLERARCQKSLDALIAKLPNKKVNSGDSGFRDLQERLSSLKTKKEKIDRRYEKCVNKYKRFTHIQDKLAEKISQDTKMRAYIIVATTILFLSMTAFFLWPAHLAGITIVAGIALASGSIMNGLGRRVFQTVKGFFTPCQVAPSPFASASPEAVMEKAPLLAPRSSHLVIHESIKRSAPRTPVFGSLYVKPQLPPPRPQIVTASLSAQLPSSSRPSKVRSQEFGSLYVKPQAPQAGAQTLTASRSAPMPFSSTRSLA